MTHIVLLVNSPAPMTPPTIQRLADLLQTDPYSIRLVLNRPRPVILSRGLDEAGAQQAVTELTELGCEAYTFALEQLDGLAEPICPRTLEFHRDHLRFVLAEGNLVLAKWDNLFLLVHGRCRLHTRERGTFTPRPGQLIMMPKTTESSKESVTDRLDIYFFDGSAPARSDCDRFSFQFLGSKLGLSDAQSMQTTVQAIRKLAPQAALDSGFEQFRRTAGPAGRTTRTDEADFKSGWMTIQTDVNDDAPRFDCYSRLSFLIHLKRAERST